MKILLTGFNQFSSLSANPSEAIVQQVAQNCRIEGVRLVTEVLPTEFVRAGNRIRELIRTLVPDAAIALGVARGTDCVRLERVALNIDDSETPDNLGDTPISRIIQPRGPVAYWSTLPLGRLMDVWKGLGVPVEISSHAGTYVCNHAFYSARHEIERLNAAAQCGLIHVPLMLEQAEAIGTAFALPLAVMAEAVTSCIDLLNQEFRSRRPSSFLEFISC